MEASKIRSELTRQLGETETKITTQEKSLTELKEYRIKIIGGLETLDLLESPDPDELAANGGKLPPPAKKTK
jgi:hypothetical protein|tara:strand:- start:54 stop:269 length:216 start_codon:yes stop_codon:yes gene_type:complete